MLKVHKANGHSVLCGKQAHSQGMHQIATTVDSEVTCVRCLAAKAPKAPGVATAKSLRKAIEEIEMIYDVSHPGFLASEMAKKYEALKVALAAL